MFRRVINGIRHFFMRFALKNDDFSIICPTCVGGAIYHQLRKQFKSPTVNLWLTEDDFYEFCNNLRWYISHEVEYYKDDETYGFPVGCIRNPVGDVIKINFNHHKSFDEAKADWDRRKARINWSKIYIIASTRGQESEEKVKRWGNISSQVAGLVCFTAKAYPDIPYVLQLKYFRTQKCCGSYMEEGRTTFLGLLPWEKDFNYVKWLNTGEIK